MARALFVEQSLLRVAGHQAEQVARLLEIVVVILAEVEVLCDVADDLGRLSGGGLLGLPAKGIGFHRRHRPWLPSSRMAPSR
jgi:hypothetical protein